MSCAHVWMEIVPTTKKGWLSYYCFLCHQKMSIADDPAHSGLSPDKPHLNSKAKAAE